MPDFEFNADFKLVAFNGGYLCSYYAKCVGCLDPDCTGIHSRTVWRNTEQECSNLLIETIRALESVPEDKVKRETQLKT